MVGVPGRIWPAVTAEVGALVLLTEVKPDLLAVTRTVIGWLSAVPGTTNVPEVAPLMGVPLANH